MRTAAFDAALATFVAGVESIYTKYMDEHFALNHRETFRLEHGKARVRVVKGDSVYCFVEYSTGDVMKAAGWKAPAKHARGNIFAADHGLTNMGPYGPAYLR